MKSGRNESLQVKAVDDEVASRIDVDAYEIVVNPRIDRLDGGGLEFGQLCILRPGIEVTTRSRPALVTVRFSHLSLSVGRPLPRRMG